MKTFLSLAIKSLLHRKQTVGLTVLSLALSIFLILSVEKLRQAAEDGFTQTISQTDLIVGARTGPTNLVLATVFNRGTFANNLKESTYEKWKANPAVEWTIPLVLGDGHRGYRVVGTTEDFYKHYHYQGQQGLVLFQGSWSVGVKDVVVGAEVARTLNYSLGHKVVIDHGVTREVGMLHHDEHPFQVVGVLAPTGTIIDQSLFVSMESLEALHHQEGEDDHRGAGEEEHHHAGEHELTAFFMKLKNRIDILTLQREINNDKQEPLTAVIPSVVVNELWQTLSYVEKALRLLGFCIFGVSLLSMVSILLATLNERRREMAILRALGGSPRQLAGLLLLESTVLMVVSLGVGLVIQWVVLLSLQGWVKETYGLFLQAGGLKTTDIVSLVIVTVLGSVMGLVPAWTVYRTTLKDGLSMR